MKLAALSLALFAFASPDATHGCFPCANSGEFEPVWASDASGIAFFSGLGSASRDRLGRVRPDGTELMVALNPFASLTHPDLATAFSPDLRRLAFTWYGSIAVGDFAAEGRDARVVAAADSAPGAPPLPGAWSPDGAWIAYGRQGTWIVRADGSRPPALVSAMNGSTVAWSPDGASLLVAGSEGLGVASLDGSSLRLLHQGATGYAAWSPDGTAIAAEMNGELMLFQTLSGAAELVADGVVARDPGSGVRHTFSWSHQGNLLAYTRLQPWRPVDAFPLGVDFEIWSVRSDGSDNHYLTDGREPAFSPVDDRLAYAAHGPCPGSGIYVLAAGSRHRLTRPCARRGSAGPDTIVGTDFSEELIGLDGDDRLEAKNGHDWLNGGRGKDRLIGLDGGQRFIGGPGRDAIEAGPGNDRVLAQDGQPDTIQCGTNRQSWLAEQDVVHADFSDSVAADCEVIYWAES